jgi:hypothetical protein
MGAIHESQGRATQPQSLSRWHLGVA